MPATDDERRLKNRTALRRRYQEDPVYREKVKAQHRAKYASDKEFRERAKADANARHRERAFGISVEQFDEMVRRQSSACAVCREIPKTTLCVDHCHTTGRVRGLLCHHCNVALGHLRDDPARITALARYAQGGDA